jgi:hypothetical protein
MQAHRGPTFRTEAILMMVLLILPLALGLGLALVGPRVPKAVTGFFADHGKR